MNAAKLEKLWRFRWQRAYDRTRSEHDRCRWVQYGGTCAGWVDKRLDTLGSLFFTGTFEEWQRWVDSVRAYAKGRTIILDARLARLDRIKREHNNPTRRGR